MIAVVHKIDLKANKITGNKEVHSMFFKGSVQQVDITIINAYVSNSRASKYMEQKLLEVKKS